MWLVGLRWFGLFLKKLFLHLKIFNSGILFIVDFYYLKFSKDKNYFFLKIQQIFIKFSVFVAGISIWSLIPYVGGMTTQFFVGLSFGLMFWLCLKISKIFFKVNSFSSHFVPLGSPELMGVAIRYVDFFSSIIRPFTLRLRLVIKISIGHIIFIILGRVLGYKILFGNWWLIFVVFFVFCFFFFIEFAVAIIQSFVFSILNVTYLSEHKIY